MTGAFYFLAAAAVFWLGLWITADDQVPGSKPYEALRRKAKIWFPFEFIEPARHAPESPHEPSSVQKAGASWRQRVQNKKR
jgi:hypothetical protein